MVIFLFIEIVRKINIILKYIIKKIIKFFPENIVFLWTVFIMKIMKNNLKLMIILILKFICKLFQYQRKLMMVINHNIQYIRNKIKNLMKIFK